MLAASSTSFHFFASSRWLIVCMALVPTFGVQPAHGYAPPQATPTPAPTPGPPPPQPAACTPANVAGETIAPGVTYYNCSGNVPAVHIVTIDRTLPAAEIRLLTNPVNDALKAAFADTGTLDGTITVTQVKHPFVSFPYSASARDYWLSLRQISDLAQSANAVVAINGFQWHGNQGLLIFDQDLLLNGQPFPMGVPNSKLFQFGQSLNTDPNPCLDPNGNIINEDPVLCEVLMGFAAGGPSGIQPQRVNGPDLAPSFASFEYQMYGSDSHVMANGVCRPDDTDSDRWSIVGYSSTQIVFLSATDTNFTPTDLCNSALTAFGVTDAIRNDGGHSPNLYVRGKGVVNPNGQLPDGPLFGGEPHIAYALGLVTISPTTSCSNTTDNAGVTFGTLCVTPQNNGYNAELKPVNDGLNRCGLFDFNLVSQDGTHIGDEGAFNFCSSDTSERSFFFATGTVGGCATLHLFERSGTNFGVTEWFTQSCGSSGSGPGSGGGSGPGDTIPPVTVARVNVPPNTNGWNNTDVTVSFAATDDQSGVRGIHVTLSGAQNAVIFIPGSKGAVTVSNEGTTTVTYFAVDNAGNTEAAKTLTLNIDKTPPSITGMPQACQLFPPNHKLVQVATVGASDSLSGMAKFDLSGVSNEPDDNHGPGIVISGSGLDPRVVQLRAERLGNGSGRTYTLTATATDRADNSAVATATCTVPHDRSK